MAAENKNADRKTFRLTDIIIIVLLLLAALAAMLLGGKTSGTAVITQDGAEIDRIRLDRDGVYRYDELPGVTFTALDGTIRISENDCADLICVRTGKISRKGEAIICMPKKIVVEIEGEPELDAVM